LLVNNNNNNNNNNNSGGGGGGSTVSLSITAGPCRATLQTVQLSGNEILNRKVLSSRRKVR